MSEASVATGTVLFSCAGVSSWSVANHRPLYTVSVAGTIEDSLVEVNEMLYL